MSVVNPKDFTFEVMAKNRLRILKIKMIREIKFKPDKRKKPQETELKDWKRYTESQYPNLIKEGYEFEGNCPPEFVEGVRKDCDAKGLEVVIGDKAFSPDLDFPLDPQAKAVFSRTKQKVEEREK